MPQTLEYNTTITPNKASILSYRCIVFYEFSYLLSGSRNYWMQTLKVAYKVVHTSV
jgi:hypothetical protein